jgi:hypothetical protein
MVVIIRAEHLLTLSWSKVMISCVFFLKRPTKALECMNVSLLYSNHRHVSATNVVIFRVAGTGSHNYNVSESIHRLKNPYNFG